MHAECDIVMVFPSVCSSVCPVPKQMDISSHCFDDLVGHILTPTAVTKFQEVPLSGGVKYKKFCNYPLYRYLADGTR